MIVGILAIISQWELENDKERTNEGLIQMCEEGKYPISCTPFGYDRINKFLKINEENAAYVREIFNLAISGMTPGKIYKELVAQGAPLHYRCGDDSIRKFLKSRYYYGYFTYKGKEYPNIVPAIIDRETWIMANEMIEKRTVKLPSEWYYFSYKIRCRSCNGVCECKSTLKKSGSQRKKYYYYYCKTCNKRINQSDLIFDVLYAIKSYKLPAENEGRNKTLKVRLATITHKINDLYDRYENNDIDDTTYLFTLGKLQNEKSKIIRKLKIKDVSDFALTDWNTMNNLEKKEFINKYGAVTNKQLKKIEKALIQIVEKVLFLW